MERGLAYPRGTKRWTMNRRQQERFRAELTAELTETLRESLSVPQPVPQVNDLWSGIVALARSSALDGKIGPGDILVSVGLSGAGFTIGGIGALCFSLTGTPWEQSGTFWEHCTRAGSYLGIMRLGLDALAIPVMWSQFLDWSVDVVAAWRGDGVDEEEDEPRTMRQISYTSSKGTKSLSIDAGPAPEPTLKIPSCNLSSGWRQITVEEACNFLRAATATGNWSRETQTILNTKAHADLSHYLQDSGEGWPCPMWNIKQRGDLEFAMHELRMRGTDGTGTDGTDGGTG